MRDWRERKKEHENVWSKKKSKNHLLLLIHLRNYVRYDDAQPREAVQHSRRRQYITAKQRMLEEEEERREEVRKQAGDTGEWRKGHTDTLYVAKHTFLHNFTVPHTSSSFSSLSYFLYFGVTSA